VEATAASQGTSRGGRPLVASAIDGADTRRRFVQRYLDPGERLGEILFGLIMVLTFTLTARATLGEEESTRSLLAALGCNLAWGIIDGGMSIMSAMLDRARQAHASRPRAAARRLRHA
jgi:hypothetical protein